MIAQRRELLSAPVVPEAEMDTVHHGAVRAFDLQCAARFTSRRRKSYPLHAPTILACEHRVAKCAPHESESSPVNRRVIQRRRKYLGLVAIPRTGQKAVDFLQQHDIGVHRPKRIGNRGQTGGSRRVFPTVDVVAANAHGLIIDGGRLGCEGEWRFFPGSGGAWEIHGLGAGVDEGRTVKDRGAGRQGDVLTPPSLLVLSCPLPFRAVQGELVQVARVSPRRRSTTPRQCFT